MTDASPRLTPLIAETSSASEVSDVRVTLARFETKLDLVIGQHGTRLDDHETRLRLVEAKPGVTPKGLVAALASTVAILGGSVAFLDRLYGA